MHPSGFADLPAPRQARGNVHGLGLVFDRDVSFEEVEGTLELARLAAESLHGPEQVELDAAWSLDRRRHTVTLNTASAAGRTLALVFLGYARREFGSRCVRVYRTPFDDRSRCRGRTEGGVCRG